MARVKRGVTAHARHKKVLALAKGYRGRRKNVRVAGSGVAGQYAYRAAARKRVFRALWIAVSRRRPFLRRRLAGGLDRAGRKFSPTWPSTIPGTAASSPR